LVEWIAKGLKREPRHSVHETLEGLLTGKYQLFRYENGIIVTQVVVYATGERRLVVHLIAGDDWLRHADQCMADLFKFADSMGIKTLEGYCRPGLEHELKKLGWKREQVVMRIRR
jgi:hypothetical protein